MLKTNRDKESMLMMHSRLNSPSSDIPVELQYRRASNDIHESSFGGGEVFIPTMSRFGSMDIGAIPSSNQTLSINVNNNYYSNNLSSLNNNSQLAVLAPSQQTLVDHVLREGEKIRQNIFNSPDPSLQRMNKHASDGSQSVNDCASELSAGPHSDKYSDESSFKTKKGIQDNEEGTMSRLSEMRVLGKEKTIKTKKSNMKKYSIGPFGGSQLDYNGAPSNDSKATNTVFFNQSVSNYGGSPRPFEQMQVRSNQQSRFNLASKNGNQIDTEGDNNNNNNNNSSRNNYSNINNNINSNSMNKNNNQSAFNSNLNNNLLNGSNPHNMDNSVFQEKKKERLDRMSIMKGNENKISFKLFKKMNIIKKFASMLLSSLPSRMFEKLTPVHYNIIGDVAYAHQNNNSNNNNSHALTNVQSQQQSERRQLGNNLLNPKFTHSFSHAGTTQYFSENSSSFLSCLFSLESTGLFLPNQMMQIVSQIILALFLIVILIINPILIAFEDSRSNYVFTIITEPIAIVVFTVQALISINTGFYQEGEVVMSRIIILKRYLKRQFPLDVATLALLAISMAQPSLQLVKLITLLRVKQFLEMLNAIEEHFQLQQKYYTAFELTKLYSTLFFVAHYCGCIFYAISRYEYNHNERQESWINTKNIADADWSVLYLSSLYFSFITMITVGYGDIVPISSKERIYVIFFTIMSCGIFAYVVNTIGQIFQEFSQKQANYKLKKYEITKYMEGRNIQRTSQIKMLKYLEYINTQEEERKYLEKGEEILQNSSKSLRDEVMRDFFGRILASSEIFKQFSPKLISQLCLLMKEITLGPGDAIFNKGDVDSKLFYVFKGAVEYDLEQETKTVRFGNFTAGQFFGQSGFFTERVRVYTAKSKGTTHIVFCKREDMLRLIQESPIDLEAFALIRDEILFKQIYCGHKCLLCNKSTHEELTCELVNLRVNRPLLIKKTNFCVDQMRVKQDRKLCDKSASWKELPLVKKHLKQFRTTCVLEALENWYDVNMEQDGNLNDKDFFLALPKVRVNENGEIVQDTDESIYSDEDIDLLSKSELMRNSMQEESSEHTESSQIHQPQMTLLQQQFAQQQQQNSRKIIRMKSRHQTTSMKQNQMQEETREWNQMFRSKTRGESIIRSPTLKPSNNNNNNNQDTESVDSTTTGNDQLQFTRNDNRHNTNLTSRTNKTNKTLGRQDSLASVKSQLKRNASRTMSHFGTAAMAGVAQPSQQSTQQQQQQLQPAIPSNLQLQQYQQQLSPQSPQVIPSKLDDKQIPSGLMPQKGESLLKRPEYYSGPEPEFDTVKEYKIYYPLNNLSSVLRQIKMSWIDQLQKKRFKTKGSYKTTQKSIKNNPKLQKSETYKTNKTLKTNKTSKSITNFMMM